MTTTNEEVRGFLEKSGYRFSFDEEQGCFTLGFYTDYYRDVSGEGHLRLAVYTADEGRAFGIVAKRLYVLQDELREASVLKALLFANALWRFARFELDVADGEAAASVVIRVMDARLTEEQVLGGIRYLYSAIDETYPMIMRARETGEVRALSPAEAEVEAVVERTGNLTSEGRAKVIQALDEALAKAGESTSSDAPERL